MASTIKTLVTDASVEDFINSVSNESKKNEGLELLKLFEEITHEKAKMWGPTMIGFGKYHYKSERSRQEGDWPLVGFSPRKQAHTLYLLSGFDEQDELLKKLGKHKTGMGCLYINKLADIDMHVLQDMVKKSYNFMKEKHKS